MRFLLALLLSFSAHAAPTPPLPVEACAAHLTYGQPQPTALDKTLICRQGYALQHDNVRKVPLWVAYVLTKEEALGCFPRTAGFSAEPGLPKDKRAADADYTGSGYDRGHLAPNSDMRWSVQAEDDANVLSNVAPQVPNLNRGAWKMLEDLVRVLVVERRSPVQVYAGPIFSPDDKTIGVGRVTVPVAFYKVLVDTKTRQVLAYIYPNREVSGDPDAFRVPYSEVVKQAGFILPLPPSPIMSRSTWKTAEKTVLDAKTAACVLN